MLSAFAPNFIFNIGATNNFIKNLEANSKGSLKNFLLRARCCSHI